MFVRLFIVHIGGGCVRLQTLYRIKLAISTLSVMARRALFFFGFFRPGRVGVWGSGCGVLSFHPT